MYIWTIDIDGTVSDSRARTAAISKKYNVDESQWQKEQVDEFINPEHIKMDKVIDGAEIITDLARRCGAKLVFLTGRSERARRATRIWLQNELGIFDSVPLVMRPDGDTRPTAEVKEDVFIKTVYEVWKGANFVFFEDEEELLKIYSKYGLALKAPDCWKVIRFGAFGGQGE